MHRSLGLPTLNSKLETITERVKNNAATVETRYRKQMDHGMSFYFDLTKPVNNLPPYRDRHTFAMYLAKDSPILIFIFVFILRPPRRP